MFGLLRSLRDESPRLIAPWRDPIRSPCHLPHLQSIKPNDLRSSTSHFFFYRIVICPRTYQQCEYVAILRDSWRRADGVTVIRGMKETENVTVVSKVVGMISAGCFGLKGGRFIVTMAVK